MPSDRPDTTTIRQSTDSAREELLFDALKPDVPATPKEGDSVQGTLSPATEVIKQQGIDGGLKETPRPTTDDRCLPHIIITEDNNKPNSIEK